MKVFIALASLLIGITSAQARTHHHHHHHFGINAQYNYAHLGGRPSRWCGWYMRTQVGHDPGPAFNVARMWAHYGHNAGGPAVGTIVVWPHHVGMIVGQTGGRWVVQSGNDGHAVRARPRSLFGAIAFRTFGFI